MSYIKTKDNVYPCSSSFVDYNGKKVYICDKNENSTTMLFDETEIVAEYDILDDACEGFEYQHQIYETMEKLIKAHPEIITEKTTPQIFGGIWTKSGFKFVATISIEGKENGKN